LVDDANGDGEVLDASVQKAQNPDARMLLSRRSAAEPHAESRIKQGWRTGLLAALWNAFELECRHPGNGQLAVVMRHVLALPPTRLTRMWLMKVLRRLWRKAEPRGRNSRI
jgi:hypothetical protein